MADSRKLLLIVDDDEPTRDALRETLEAEGYQVVTASNGAEAMARMLQSPHPDLAIIDLMMPVMDGWELASRLRAEPQFTDLPVIIVTAFGERALATAPVAAAYLTKPLRADRLVEEVRRAFQRLTTVRPASSRRPAGDASTPIRASGPYPLLQQAAEETANDLAALAEPEAHELARELVDIGSEIRRWRPNNPPTDEHRTRVTDQLIVKIRRAFALLGRSGISE